MSAYRELEERYERLLERVGRLEQRAATLNPRGKVAQRDHEKGVRLQIGGTDENPFLTPWIQPPDLTGTSRYLPQLGDQYMVNSHGGNWEAATLQPLTHTDEKKNPAKHADETVWFQSPDGKIRFSCDQKAGTVTLKNDKSTTTWEKDKTSIEQDGNKTVYEKDTITFPDGSKVYHGPKNIGKDHVHKGVMPGAGKTQDPDE